MLLPLSLSLFLSWFRSLYAYLLLWDTVKSVKRDTKGNSLTFLLDNLDKEYDVFVSFADEDLYFIEDTIIPLLENDDTMYKLMLHHRDFHFGSTIAHNIAYGLEHSTSVLFIVSRYFLAIDRCMFEFQPLEAVSLYRDP